MGKLSNMLQPQSFYAAALRAGPGPYDARQSDQSALAQSMAGGGYQPPIVDRATFLPIGRDASGEVRFPVWPEAVNALMRSAMMPGHLASGGSATPDEMQAAAFDLATGITGTSFFAAPRGVLASGAARSADNAAGAVDDVAQGITAYHGSPHTYKAERLVQMPDGSLQFIEGAVDQLPDVPESATVIQDFPLGRQRMDKIGTGEGAQAYGHGLYEAENEGVARQYRPPTGSMYEVRINANPDDFLDFDVPLAQQSEKVRDALSKFRLTGEITDGMPLGANGRLRIVQDPDLPEYRKYFMVLDSGEEFRLFDKDLTNFIAMSNDEVAGRNILSTLATQYGTEAAATTALREAGIPGIKYLDAGSRNKMVPFINGQRAADRIDDIAGQYIATWGNRPGRIEIEIAADRSIKASDRPVVMDRINALLESGADVQMKPDGSRNYVVFDDKLIEILRRYGLIPPVAAGLGLAATGNDAEAGQ